MEVVSAETAVAEVAVDWRGESTASLPIRGVAEAEWKGSDDAGLAELELAEVGNPPGGTGEKADWGVRVFGVAPLAEY